MTLMGASAAQGLKEHLRANHGLLAFGFAPDHPDVVPAVNVYCPPDLHDGDNRPMLRTGRIPVGRTSADRVRAAASLTALPQSVE